MDHRLETLKNQQNEDNNSQKSSQSPTLSPTLNKGLQWTLRKNNKSRRSEDGESIKKIGDKGFDLLPVERDKQSNTVHQGNTHFDKGRRGSANLIFKPTNNPVIPSPTS